MSRDCEVNSGEANIDDGRAGNLWFVVADIFDLSVAELPKIARTRATSSPSKSAHACSGLDLDRTSAELVGRLRAMLALRCTRHGSVDALSGVLLERVEDNRLECRKDPCKEGRPPASMAVPR